jgi:RNA recognition motif-containing protein
MSTEIFVDGICNINDDEIQHYFSQFGARQVSYDAHRHRLTNACCFALISFASPHTIDAILTHRPHTIHGHAVFVKRSLPSGVCSFIERLLPVSSVFVSYKVREPLNEHQLRNYFDTFGQILTFEHDRVRHRWLIEYEDYDSVDRIFLQQDRYPYSMNVRKNVSPRAQSSIPYHGTCHRDPSESTVGEKEKRRRRKKRLEGTCHDLPQTTSEDLNQCRNELRSQKQDYERLRMGKITPSDEEGGNGIASVRKTIERSRKNTMN